MRNGNDGLSVLAVSEAANNTLTERLQRMRELTVQSANGVLSRVERKYLQSEFKNLIDDIKDAAVETKFNGIGLTLGGSLDVQAGANQSDNNRINIALSDHKTIHLGIRLLNVNTEDDARSAMAVLDKEMDRLNKFQASIGSDMNRISAALRFTSDQETALTAAASRITDTDYALETADMTAQQIKSQASTAAIAQANGLARGVIGLIA
jgi:flagellin